jgi:hypothetical protein
LVVHFKHYCPPFDMIRSHFHPYSILTTHSLRSILKLSSQFLLGLLSGHYPRGFPTIIHGAIGKLLDCYCCNWLDERRRDGRQRSHFHKPIASVCHMTPPCEHALFLYECFSDFVFRFVCNGWQNWATRLLQVLHEDQ